MYRVRQGETIRDVVLNSTGSLSAWDTIVSVFNTWTPLLVVNQEIETPLPIEPFFVQELDKYSLNNKPDINNLDSQILALTEVLDNIEVFEVFEQPGITANPDNLYIVKAGETIRDVIINSTGTISNWESIIDANGLDWVPELTTGQKIKVVYDELQQNVLHELQENQLCNIPQIPDLNTQINDLIAKFTRSLTFQFDDGNDFTFDDNEPFELSAQ